MADDVLSISRADIDAAQARRASLHRASSHLRSLLILNDDHHPVRHSALAEALADVAHLWDRHIAATEAPEGLLAQIVNDAPRLAGMVNRFRREHPVIGEQLAAARQILEEVEGGIRDDLDALGARLLTLLDGIDRHRRGGHELLHRAYCIDIGLGE